MDHAELARRAAVSRDTIADFENGGRTASARRRIKGNALGQEYLGYAYEDGAGVPKAYVWRTSDGSLGRELVSRPSIVGTFAPRRD